MTRKNTSPTGNHSNSGFTLIELVVVIAIMAVALGVAAITIQDARPTYVMQQESQRLQAALRGALDDAMLHGHQWGMMMEAGEYHFVVFDKQTGQWLDATDPLLAKHTLPDSLALTLEATNRLILPLALRVAIQPAILLLSSGITSTFVLHLQDKNDQQLSVTFNADGHSGIVMSEGDAKKS